MKSRILTDAQVRLASNICSVLDGASEGDALAALGSIVACTLVERSAEPGVAIGKATAFGLQLEKRVEAGLRGQLIRNDRAPFDMRFVI